MEIAELKERRKKLEKDLNVIIDAFIEETGTKPEIEFQVTPVGRIGQPLRYISNVDVTISVR